MATITAEELSALVTRALKRAGASKSMAAAAAQALVTAEAEGLSGHGVSRTALYAQHLRDARVDGKAKARIAKRHGATCLIDARGGLAFEAAALAAKEAVKRAPKYGVAFAGVTNSHHFGAAAYHLTPAAEAGLVALAFTNSPSAINAWGGKRALFGTNPIAAVFPRRDAPAIVIDLSLTEVVRGKIMLHAKEGKPIPLGWAVDKEGNPTTDPQAALTGSLSAIGGAKGTALALMVELISCALTGAAFSFQNDSYFEAGNKPRIGHAIAVVDPEALVGRAAYFDAVEVLVSRMLEDEAVRLPGMRRHLAAERARTQGLELSDAALEELKRLAL